MSKREELRRAALEIFAETIRSVSSSEAVRRAVRLEGSLLRVFDTEINLSASQTKIYSIGIGKAAREMAVALDCVLGERLAAGVFTGTQERALSQPASKDFRKRWRAYAGGHPLPNASSLEAAKGAFEILQRADAERAVIIFLISGGGSAMIEWPRTEEITLDDLRAANRLLVTCGATIAEVNAVRRAFSAVKGGGLSERAPHALQISLIISDTNAGEEANVASGPTLAPNGNAPTAVEVIARYHLSSKLPASILRAAESLNTESIETSNAETSQSFSHKYYVLLDNGRALEAAAKAARAFGFTVETAHDLVEQPVEEGCAQLLNRLLALAHRNSGTERRAVCLISGGEFVCPVRGAGTGGRNSETVLRCSIEIDERKKIDERIADSSVVLLSAGTDGIDGNSPAAGAIADAETIKRARALGLNAKTFLETSDAHTLFDSLNDTIITGPTGTNVRDVRIMLVF